MAASLIEAMNLSKIYGPPFSPFGLIKRAFQAGFTAVSGKSGIKAVDSLSFSVEKGGVCGFLGPNGAGKTTTLKMLAGLLRPTCGEVRLFGKNPAKEWSSIFSRTGGLIDKPNLYDSLSGKNNLLLKSHLYNVADKVDFDSVLDQFHLLDAADRKVSTYSTGMKQRLAIAAAMIHDPELLFLDEPTRGLDPKGQAEIRDILLGIRSKGNTTIFISSHMLHEVEQICDKVVIIDRGEHLYTGSVSDLEKEDRRVRLVTYDKKKTVQALDASKLVASFDHSSSGKECSFTITMKNGSNPDIGRLMVDKNIDIIELGPVTNSLEDFFLKVTAGKEA